MQKLFAFWNYSYASYTGIPGYLGGTVTEVKPSGEAKIEEYGYGTFLPVFTLPVKEGRALMGQLDDLQRDYEKACKQVDVEFTKKIANLVSKARARGQK